MKLTARQHTVLATVLILVISYIVRLSALEIQPWDEGLYAVRGESIVKYGTVWDQTEHSIGGLYSSIPAPMTAWHVAIGIATLGRTVMGVRVIGILDAGIALVFLYLILQRFTDHRKAMFGMLLCGTSLHWVIYSRQAMAEVPLMTYMLVALWASIRIREELSGDAPWKRMEVLVPLAVFGVALGFSMLTKLVVGALPLMFVAPLLLHAPMRRPVIMSILLACCIGLPWYISMLASHGEPFFQALLLRHLSTVVEGNTNGLGYLYYINQLVVSQPWLVFSFVVGWASVVALTRGVFKDSRSTTHAQWTVGMAWLWFAASLIVLSVAPTKNPHYVVVLIPPALIVALYWSACLVREANRKIVVLTFLLVAVATIWSVLPEQRGAVQHHPLQYIPIVCAALLLFGCVVFIPKAWAARLVVVVYEPLLIVALLCSSYSAARVIWRPSEAGVITGGRLVATQLIESGSKSFTYLYHRQNDADSLNPQLAWYTAGWMMGQEPDRTYRPVALPQHSSSLDAVAQVAFSGTPYVVYYHTNQDDVVKTEVLAALSVTYSVDETVGNYTLLSRNR